MASKAGLDLLSSTHPDVEVTVGVVDPTLTECGIVLPGMGDVGDRLFGTGNHDFDDPNAFDVAAATPASEEDSTGPAAKRKRSASLELEMDLASKKK